MDKELLEAGYRAYTGEKIDVYFNTAICQHSGNCVRGSAKLFNLKRKPWIIPMKLGKVHARQLGYDTGVVKKYFNFSTFAQLLSENSNNFILTGLYRSLCHMHPL
ncbi:hypothetical protein AI2861V1_0881 [Klebsiella pneumoniae]|nr:hypothetical protein AI2861V1_0881 [Klebsiella pneumoniae]CAH5135016.1 hypothetical protein AI2861V1_0881 [Klebsiella pneumoniae]